MARSGTELPQQWARHFIAEHMLGQMDQLQHIAFDEYWSFARLWIIDPSQRACQFDTQRLLRLMEISDDRSALLLQPYDRRLVFNVFRALLPDELNALLFLAPADFLTHSRMLIGMSRAIAWYGTRRDSLNLEGSTVVTITQGEWRQIALHLPQDIARLYGLAALRITAESAFRRAGKGARLRPLKPLRPGQEGSLFEFETDSALDSAIGEYDHRRWETGGAVAGLAAPSNLRSADWTWPTVGFCESPVTVAYPRLKLSHRTQTFMLYPVDVTRRMAQLADYPSEFEATFGLELEEFRQICELLALTIWHLTGYWELRLDEHSVEEFRLESSLSPTDPRSASAPGYLRDVLFQALLRAPKSTWKSTLSVAHPITGERAQAGAIARFLEAFTARVGRDPLALQPTLFFDLEENSLTLDLTLSKQFFDLCFHAISVGRGGETGRRRGRQFEEQARKELIEGLSLASDQLPLAPNFKLRKAGLNDGEVDFCFVMGSTLVHLDMKSYVRQVSYHMGDHRAVRNRLKEVAERLRKQVDPRGFILLEHFRGQGRQLDTVVNLLCVADVEFVPMAAALRYGSVSRVLTPSEIVELSQDKSRWQEVVRAASAATANYDGHSAASP